MKRHVLVVFCYFVLTANLVSAATKSIKVDVGGLKIDIQAPVGFHEISSLSPKTRKLFETVTPPDNRLLAVFVSKEDLGRIMKGKAPNFYRFINLQVSRKLEDKNISNALFQQLANQIKEEHHSLLETFKYEVGGLIERGAEKLSAEYDLSIKIKNFKQVPLGIFLDKPGAVGLAYLVKNNVEVEGEQLDYVVAGAGSLLLIRGRVLYAYVFSRYQTQNDINWVRSKSKEWVDSLLTSNISSTYNSGNRTSLRSGIDWDRVARKAIDGAITGAIRGAIVAGFMAFIIALFQGAKRIFKKKE